MDNLAHILALLFKRIPAKPVLDGKIKGTQIEQEEFVRVAFVYRTEYSESDLANLWLFLKDYIEQNRIWFGRPCEKNRCGIDVFDVLFSYVKDMLVEQYNEILCCYEKLLPWRMITFELSEDLLVSSYFARCKTPKDMEQIGFDWEVVIGHNNMPLRNILRQGIAENHFHLYGSAPMFHLSWLSLMNNVLTTKAAENLYRFDHDRRRSNIRFGDLYEENSLVAQFYQAALIRIFLFSVLTEDGIAVSTCDDSDGKGLLTFTKVMELLNDNYLMQEQLVEIQSLIDVFRFIPHGVGNGKEDNLQDYALLGVEQRHGSSNDIFAGERWFLYSCLYQIYRARFSDEYENLFYAYLLIKENIRSEMIQSNSNVGFVNFNKYETRKWGLMDNAIFGNEVVRAAVNRNMLSEHLRSLEIRISPKNTAKEDMQMIRRLDTIIGEPREKYFYTVHFIKGEDKIPYQSGILQCRQEQKRSEVHRKASALIELRERFPKCACRVLGIDAAANEIGCRPEVFAPEFRRLRNHVKTLEDSLSGKRVPQLRVTYHVGEDFLDLADGLRAIDEAVNFLNMDCGDRLGHALALGVDVEGWYSSKNNRILISQQDYLDNLAWMYNRLIEYKISDVDVLKDYLLKKYEFYFDRVYARYMDYGLVDAILEKARVKYREKNITNAFHNDRYRFEIFQYYNAWKLRGDDPNLYAHGYFWWEDEDIPEVSYRVNLKFPGKFSMRYRPEVFLINYYYQYEEQVRIEGNRRIEIKIKPEYIRGVKLLQKEMQKDIGRRGIAIETNPSSNFLIGTFKDYAKHPILSFYNRNLTDDFDRLQDCPQLSVSVNTDDQGVFSTSLENEYSLLANALENAVDEDGDYIYNRTMIYSWIDDIRKMGINQSFVVDTEEYGKLLNEKSRTRNDAALDAIFFMKDTGNQHPSPAFSNRGCRFPDIDK